LLSCGQTFQRSPPVYIRMPQLRYTTPHGITVIRDAKRLNFNRGLKHILKQLDTKHGVYLSSGYEYPERYSRWDFASVAPPLEIVGRDRKLLVRALNDRGQVLLKLLFPIVASHSHWETRLEESGSVVLNLKPLAERFS